MNSTGWWLTLPPPETVGVLVADLRRAGLLPESQTWWFAWNALNIELPGPLTDMDQLEDNWDVLRVFSKQAELRLGRRGGKRACWLLLEDEALKKYDRGQVGQPESFTVEAGYHLLAGQKLRLPAGDKRGELLYPCPMDYHFGDKEEELENALVAAVWNYYDHLHRLVTVRYAALQVVKPGSISVQPFPGPQEVFKPAVNAKGGN